MPFARKRFGQHFLERAWVDKLIQAIAPSADQTFLEIGPGRGALTIPLAARARHESSPSKSTATSRPSCARSLPPISRSSKAISSTSPIDTLRTN